MKNKIKVFRAMHNLTQEHLAQHRLLHHITTTAASGTTLNEALQSAVNGLQVTLADETIMYFMLKLLARLMVSWKRSISYGSTPKAEPSARTTSTDPLK